MFYGLFEFFVDIKMTFNRKNVNTFYPKTKNSFSMQYQIFPYIYQEVQSNICIENDSLKQLGSD